METVGLRIIVLYPPNFEGRSESVEVRRGPALKKAVTCKGVIFDVVLLVNT